MGEERKEERWHVGKEISIALVVGFSIQLFTTGMWFGGLEKQVTKSDNTLEILTKKLEDLSYQVAALTFEKRERERDNAIINQKFQVIENEIASLKRRQR